MEILYRTIDNYIIILCLGIAGFYWRGAMGIGGFLNAKLTNQYREYTIKYLYYKSLVDTIPTVVLENIETVKVKYRKIVVFQYITIMVPILFLIMMTLETLNNVKNNTISQMIVNSPYLLFYIFGIVFMVIFSMFFAHTSSKKLGYVHNINKNLDKLIDNIDTT